MQGAVPMGECAWERARIMAGRPAADRELTELYNPLEAGLYHAVSITKASACMHCVNSSLLPVSEATRPGCRAATSGRRRWPRW